MRRWSDIVFCAGLFFLLLGCRPIPEDTIIFLGGETYVQSVSEIIRHDEWEHDVLSHMQNVSQGYFPPDIEGEYKISEKQFVTSNFNDLSDHQDMYLKVMDQHNRIASVLFYEGERIYTDTAYVMGDGQRFSLYFTEDREMVVNETAHTLRRFVIFTGEKTPQGIRDLYFGSLILDAGNGDDPFVGSFIPGWYFIYKDKDGLSENCDWFSQHEEGGEGDE